MRITDSVARGLVLGLLGILGLGLAGGPVLAMAQELPPPPEIADTIVSDPLTSEVLFAPGVCPTGLAVGGNAGEGYILAVSGPCRQGSDTADVAVLGRGVTLPDGDVSVAFKVVSGGARTGLRLYSRVHGRSSVGAYLNPGSGEITLFKIEDGVWSELASRDDGLTLLGEAAESEAVESEGAWHRMSVRALGGEIWLLLDGEPVLYSADIAPATGGIGLQLLRTGSVDDDEEALVVFVDLTVSSLAVAIPERAPTYQHP